MSKKLLPCRWCNTDPDASRAVRTSGWNTEWWIECANCGVRGPRTLSADGAIAAWNHRKPLAAIVEPPGETVEVRGCFGVGVNNSVYAYCSTRMSPAALREEIEGAGYTPTAFFTVLVPVEPPLLPVITATVEPV